MIFLIYILQINRNSQERDCCYKTYLALVFSWKPKPNELTVRTLLAHQLPLNLSMVILSEKNPVRFSLTLIILVVVVLVLVVVVVVLVVVVVVVVVAVVVVVVVVVVIVITLIVDAALVVFVNVLFNVFVDVLLLLSFCRGCDIYLLL